MLRFRTQPFPYQLEDLERYKDYVANGYFHEPGLGKTKIAIDNATYLLDQQKVNAVVVFAPNGVHQNWPATQLPRHCPEDVLANSYVFSWHTGKASTKKFQAAAERVFTSGKIPYLFFSYDAVMTEAGRNFLRRVFARHRVLLICDESQFFKSPGAARTKRVLAAGEAVAYRRILTGTPIYSSPFDCYSQIKFLQRSAWDSIGASNYFAFKAFFGIFEQGYAPGGRTYEALKGFKNMSVLREIVRRWGPFRRAEDVLSQLPERVYERHYFELSTKARVVYESVCRDFMAEVHGTELLTAELAIVRATRLQQISSGYCPSDDDATPRLLEPNDKNPRVEAAIDVLYRYENMRFIVWAKYDLDCSLLARRFEEEGISFVRYDGTVDEDQRAQNLSLYCRPGGPRIFLAKTSVGGTGLTIVEAQGQLFYNVSPGKYGERIQAEKRSYRLGQQSKFVLYVDLVAEDTVDDKILEDLLRKHEIADGLSGTTVRGWLSS